MLRRRFTSQKRATRVLPWNSIPTQSSADEEFATQVAESGAWYATEWNRTFINGAEVPSRAITTKQELIDEAVGIGASSWPGGEPEAALHLDLETDPSIKVYGSHCMRMNRFDTDGVASGAWAFRPDGLTATVRNRFYIRYEFYIARDSLAYRYQLDSPSQPQQMKILNLAQNGAGQVAITLRRFLGIVSYFTQDASFNNAGGALIGTPNPWSSSQEWMHNALDLDTGVAVSTKDQYLARYGPLHGMVEDEGAGYDYNAGNPYLYNRGLSHGWPDSRIAHPINYDGVTVLEVFFEYNGAASTVEIFQSARGQRPVLICRQVGSAPVGGGGDDMVRFELLFYDTHALSEPGVRPTLNIYPISLIVAPNPIKFPGGHALPDNPLSTLASQLTPGRSALLPTTWTGTDIPTNADFNWNNKWFLDEARGLGYGATKLAGVDTAMQHFVYDRANNMFRSVNCGFNRSGHVFDCIAYDYATGIGYLVPGGGPDNKLYHTTLSAGSNPAAPTAFSEDAWTQIPSIMYAGGQDFVSGETAMEFHPNLFGTGDGGHIIVCQNGIAARRLSTGAYSVIVGTGQFSQADTPAAIYSRGLDAVIVTTNVSSFKAFRIDRNNSFTQIDNTPMYFGPDRGTPDTAALIDDPNGAATMWAIEKVPNGRVWKLTGGTSWAQQVGVQQPFTAVSDTEDWMVAPDRKTGCFAAIERTATNGRMRVLRPPS